MTTPTPADLRALLEAATPGPWRWSNTTRDVYLFAGNQRVVMAFERWGMQGAQPVFNINGILHPAGKENINKFPDAALIAAAVNALPALLDDLKAAREEIAILTAQRDRAERRRERLESGVEALAGEWADELRTGKCPDGECGGCTRGEDGNALHALLAESGASEVGA